MGAGEGKGPATPDDSGHTGAKTGGEVALQGRGCTSGKHTTGPAKAPRALASVAAVLPPLSASGQSWVAAHRAVISPQCCSPPLLDVCTNCGAKLGRTKGVRAGRGWGGWGGGTDARGEGGQGVHLKERSRSQRPHGSGQRGAQGFLGFRLRANAPKVEVQHINEGGEVAQQKVARGNGIPDLGVGPAPARMTEACARRDTRLPHAHGRHVRGAHGIVGAKGGRV
jgi:hypothetical protein